MTTPILMPALSPTMEEGKLAKWHVKVGDKVLFTSYAPETIKLNDEELLLMREEDILAIID